MHYIWEFDTSFQTWLGVGSQKIFIKCRSIKFGFQCVLNVLHLLYKGVLISP